MPHINKYAPEQEDQRGKDGKFTCVVCLKKLTDDEVQWQSIDTLTPQHSKLKPVCFKHQHQVTMVKIPLK